MISHITQHGPKKTKAILNVQDYLSQFDKEKPQQIHLSINENVTSMVVMWVTFVVMENPICKYWCVNLDGDSCEGELLEKGAVVRLIERDWDGFIYVVTLEDLVPASEYEYMVGNKGTDNFSEVFQFKTRPEGPFPTTVVTFADFDAYNDIVKEKTVIERLIRNVSEFDMVLEFGDVSYADGNPLTWDLFFNHIQPIAAVRPWMVSVGNHENEPNYGFDHFDKRFCMSRENNFWYSFNYGYGHWCVISTEHSLEVDSEQYNWLINDLKTANKRRNANPWIIITGHRALYGSNTRWFHKEKAKELRKNLVPIIDKYSVDLAIFGHCHAYERTHPLKEDEINPFGTIYLLAGVAGADLDKEFKDQPQWSAYRTAHHGYGLLHIKNEKKLRFCYTRERDGQSWDAFTIKKNRSGKKQIYYDYENQFLSNWYVIPEKPEKLARSEQKKLELGYEKLN